MNTTAKPNVSNLICELAEITFWDFDPRLFRIEWDARKRTFHGLDGADTQTETYLREIHRDDRAAVQKTLAEALSSTGPESKFVLSFKSLCEADNGIRVVRHIQVNGRVDFHEGEVIRFTGVSRDVTNDRKSAEIIKAKSNYVATVSHEMRTPLGIIIGFAELGLDPERNREEMRMSLQTIKKHGEQLLGLVSEVLDLAKADACRVDFEKANLSVPAFFRELEHSFRHQCEEKGLRFSVSVAPNVPKAIYTDEQRLRQILMNLLSNAIKFTSVGQIRVDAKVETDRDSSQERFVIRVTDTGVGIEKNHHAKLFQPFSQCTLETNRRFGGTGLGLALSQKLAQGLGGELKLKESIKGYGSSFEVCFPMSLIQTIDFSPETSSMPVANEADPDLNGVSVLLAEDAQDNQILVTRYLERAGAKVDVAKNGQEAVEKARSSCYDVVLMDLQMPVLDGYEATQTLRAEGYDRPIIALTAHAMSEERERCLTHGFDDHMTKPLNRIHLLHEVGTFARGAN